MTNDGKSWATVNHRASSRLRESQEIVQYLEHQLMSVACQRDKSRTQAGVKAIKDKHDEMRRQEWTKKNLSKGIDKPSREG